MKKRYFVLCGLLLALILFVGSVQATQPEHYTGYVPLLSYIPGPPGGVTVYDVCDPVLQGQVVQPAETPGKAVHGVFTMGDSPYCDGTPTLEGTCQMTLLPVEEPFNPASKEGRAVINRCTGDLSGLHMTGVIHYDFTYDAWYHFKP